MAPFQTGDFMQIIRFISQYAVAVFGLATSAAILGFTAGVCAGAVYYFFQLAFKFWSNL